MNAAAKKILVVDDDHDIREIIMYILQAEGFEVMGLGNGGAVLETVQVSRPDMVLLDVQLGAFQRKNTSQQTFAFAVTAGSTAG